LFPAQGALRFALDGFFALAVVIFMLVAGLEISCNELWRQRSAALRVSIGGLIVPLAVGVLSALALPEFFGLKQGVPQTALAFFFGLALSVSALPVIARILMDLKLYQHPIGYVVIASAMLDDLIVWMLFALLLGLLSQGSSAWSQALATAGMTLAVFVGTLTLLRSLAAWIGRQAGQQQRNERASLGFVMATALLCSVIVSTLGIHPNFGAFLFGLAIADSRLLSAESRRSLLTFASVVIAPVFFAGVGLRLDFYADFDLALVSAVFVLACASKLVGCSIGARLSAFSWPKSLAIGFAMNARGAVGIILGFTAFQADLISSQLLVALIVMALLTSMLSAGAMRFLLRKQLEEGV
jgi:Kef-type K+ transport system membrane component KefB